VLKQRFRILLLAPAYSIEIQSRIPAALAALHNFIQAHNPSETTHLDHDSPDHAPGGFYAGDDPLIPGEIGEDKDSEASRRRNQIANDMWRQYTLVLQQRAQEGYNGISDDDDDDDDYSGED
jgi:hypothetical protein